MIIKLGAGHRYSTANSNMCKIKIIVQKIKSRTVGAGPVSAREKKIYSKL